jgi:hypothetical protein
VLCVSALAIITLVVRVAQATWTPAPAPAG